MLPFPTAARRPSLSHQLLRRLPWLLALSAGIALPWGVGLLDIIHYVLATLHHLTR